MFVSPKYVVVEIVFGLQIYDHGKVCMITLYTYEVVTS
jgi:hypothetical protein